MRMVIIFNPRSGRPRPSAPILPLLKDFIAQQRLDAQLFCTEGPGHATELARDAVAGGCRRVIAVGGDGTVNEVAQALIHSPAAMGLVPCGSGNGLALHLGLPRSVSDALELATGSSSHVAEIDTGVVNGLPFVNAMGLGLDADVSERFNHLTKRGLPAYARTAMKAFLERKTYRCLVTASGQLQTIDALLLSVTNSDQYGNNAKIAPHARVDDGALDLVAIRPVGFLSAGFLGARLFLGTIDKSSRVRRLRGPSFVIERPAAGVIHTDGETHMAAATLEVSVRSRSLKILVPAGCMAVSITGEAAKAGFALQMP